MPAIPALYRLGGDQMPTTSKRIRFTLTALITIALLADAAWSQNHSLTAREVVSRIQKQVGVPWQSDTVDTFKAGDPNAQVTGIAVTMMATLDMLQRAAASGDSTTTGMRAIRTASRPAWFMPWVGRSFRTRKTSTCSTCPKHLLKNLL